MQRKEYAAEKPRDASKLRIGIIVATFNEDITGALLAGALDTLSAWSVAAKNIRVVHVPGSFEVPLAIARLAKSKRYDAFVALGCILKGETRHDEYIAHAVAHALQHLMLEYGTPIGFGIITPNTLAQAKARSRGTTNHGASAAQAALEMAL